jgi:CheY-like chemotaxis protein
METTNTDLAVLNEVQMNSQAAAWQPDLIVSDITMPELDGIPIRRSARGMAKVDSSPGLPARPNSPHNRDKGRSYGFNGIRAVALPKIPPTLHQPNLPSNFELSVAG